MHPMILDHFKEEAIKKMDHAILEKCHIKVRHPEALADTIIELCERYYQLEKEEEF